MYKIMRVLFVIPAVVLIGLIVSTGWAHAQQAPASAATQGCDPCIINRTPPSPAEYQKEVQRRLKYCAAHPEKCGPADWGWTNESRAAVERASEAQAKQDPNYYKKQGPGHTTECFPGAKPVCIPDTWWTQWPTEPQPGHCYSNPKNPSERRCVPTREQLMKAG